MAYYSMLKAGKTRILETEITKKSHGGLGGLPADYLHVAVRVGYSWWSDAGWQRNSEGTVTCVTERNTAACSLEFETELDSS